MLREKQCRVITQRLLHYDSTGIIKFLGQMYFAQFKRKQQFSIDLQYFSMIIIVSKYSVAVDKFFTDTKYIFRYCFSYLFQFSRTYVGLQPLRQCAIRTVRLSFTHSRRQVGGPQKGRGNQTNYIHIRTDIYQTMMIMSQRQIHKFH